MSKIACIVHADGSVAASGGRLRRWLNWTPSTEDIRITSYGYTVPTQTDRPADLS